MELRWAPTRIWKLESIPWHKPGPCWPEAAILNGRASLYSRRSGCSCGRTPAKYCCSRPRSTNRLHTLATSWAIRQAFARMADSTRTARSGFLWRSPNSGSGQKPSALLQLMNPAETSRDLKSSAHYGGEPYVSPADVYSSPQHAGRCGWTWYTGSAAWSYRIWIEAVLGFRVQGDQLSLDPALPAGWNDFELDFRHGEANYHITVRRDPSASVRLTRVNDQQLETDWIPLVRERSQNEIVLLLPAEPEPIKDANEESVSSTGRLVRAE